MGYVVVVSVPVILFIVIIALAFYLIGRANGRREAVSAQQHFGPPVPPPLQAQEKSDQGFGTRGYSLTELTLRVGALLLPPIPEGKLLLNQIDAAPQEIAHLHGRSVNLENGV
ncbi:hypothetical protein L3X38_013314 [Prunus dulcis]|uniref:Uncharacterized protein n=1 Tax=Prunus dulcis TaxID=3755 RepID=A0AAD4WNN3_PRUDU|nr:hypothetical protein L3X38_013314 [Prunus dulcis]